MQNGSLASPDSVGQEMQIMGVVWRILVSETNNPEHPGCIADYPATDFAADLDIGKGGFTANINATSKFDA